MARSTVHYADNQTNNILKALHNKLRPAGTPVMRVEYIIELLLLRIFEVKLKHDKEFEPLRKLFDGDNYRLLFSHLLSINGNAALVELNKNIFSFYGNILGKAREVYKNKNLPQKVQDQLVLIEEVFSNSSFNNNVKNGNLSEIISLINDIDEARLLKTDLLGDAIESALSEQGGTKDVGLYRTPNHIRQMMVAMVDPDFKDIIFDPACGTGGFLFDAFQYVLEKVSKDGKWPGEKAHKEIRAYLEKHIKNINTEMPSSNVANTFYRVGISGVEYLGMIRKMAAINLYIRGLNPANIEQGDSLDLFDPGVDSGTKSIVIANPPFGAKLDQPAYPNVWEEYPKTDSTTLFVKLMFNHLKNGGKCAVVVSEGFLTWDNEPAKEMRKILLEEANLKAIISLPQGVFVSKNGQGAKTSILYFEKGEPTKNVWYYKITNDGYSMGINRKEIFGCQVPEVLELFSKYIKHEKISPKTKNSFTIPVEWIKQIDPRLKQRIMSETAEQQKGKVTEKRKLEIKKLDDKLKKEKITKKEYEEKIWQFDNVIENNIQNETAKRIEKAHSHSFNLQNYRSNLSDDQIKKWQSAFEGIKIKNGENIEARYQELLKADQKTALQILASFNPESALEMDIAREYLSKIEKNNKGMEKLEKILKEGNKYPIISLNNLLISNENKIKPKKYPDEQFIVLGVSNTGGVFINEKKNGSKIDQSYFVVGKNQFCYNPYRINVGSIGLNNFENGDRQIISGAYVIFGVNENEIDPRYLLALFKTKSFNKYVNEQATGGVRMNFKFEYLQSWQIPLPPIEIQQEIVEKIERQKAIIDGAEKVLNNLDIDIDVNGWDKCFFDTKYIKIIDGDRGENYPKQEDFLDKGYCLFLNTKNVTKNGFDFKECMFITKEKNDRLRAGKVERGDLVLTTRGTIGNVGYYKKEANFPCVRINSGMIVIRVVSEKIEKEYLYYAIRSNYVQNQFKKIISGAAQPQLPVKDLKTLNFPLPPIDIQKQVVARLEEEMGILQQVGILKKQAEEKIDKILSEIWGE
jgi:type I restriction-modification system DNA methylase subunit/restriction endonuclease S subunit